MRSNIFTQKKRKEVDFVLTKDKKIEQMIEVKNSDNVISHSFALLS